MQDTLQAAADPQTVANGYIVDCETSSGAPFKLAGAPVQYDGVPAAGAARARVQRARRRDPRVARARHGRDRGPQGPRRRRLTRHPTDTTHHHQEQRDMGLFDAFGYKGKRTLVVGGASGMGAAIVDVLLDAGAEVTMMDRAEVSKPGVTFHPGRPRPTGPRSRRPPRPSTARSTRCSPAPGVAQGTPGIEKINFLGHRLLHRAAARGRQAPPRLRHRDDLLGRRLRLGAEPREGQRLPRRGRLRGGRPVGARATARPTTSGARSPSTPTWRARRSSS